MSSQRPEKASRRKTWASKLRRSQVLSFFLFCQFVCVSSFYRREHNFCATFGSKLAHGTFRRQPQSDRGVLARIQVQSLLFRTCIFSYSKTVVLNKDSVLQSVYMYIYINMLPRIFLAVTALSGFFCEFEPGCGDRDTSMLFNFRNCWRPTCSVCMLHCSQAVERSLSFFQRPARCGAASVTFVTSRDL